MKLQLGQDVRFYREDSRVIRSDRQHPTLQLQDMIADLYQFNREVIRYLGKIEFHHIGVDIKSLKHELKLYDQLKKEDKTQPYTIINGKTFEEIDQARHQKSSIFKYPSILDTIADKIGENEGIVKIPGTNPTNGEEIFETRFSSYEAFLDQLADHNLNRFQRCQLVVHYLLCMLRDNGLLPNNRRIKRLHDFISAFPQAYTWIYTNQVYHPKEEMTLDAYWAFHYEVKKLMEKAISKRGTEDLILKGPDAHMQLAMIHPNLTVEGLRVLAVESVFYCLGNTLMGIPLSEIDFVKIDGSKFKTLQDILHTNLYKIVGFDGDLLGNLAHFDNDWLNEQGQVNPNDEYLDHLSYLATTTWEKECD